MSGKDYVKITIRPGLSYRLAALLLVSHGGAAAVLFFLPIPPLVTWILVLLLTASLIYYWRLELLHLGSRAVNLVEWNAEGTWTLAGPDGVEQSIVLDGSSFLHPGMMVLNFILSEGGRRHLILFRDGIDPALYRKLSVRLRLYSGK